MKISAGMIQDIVPEALIGFKQMDNDWHKEGDEPKTEIKNPSACNDESPVSSIVGIGRPGEQLQ